MGPSSSWLVIAILCGLSASGLTQTIRAMVPQSWLLHKPLSCDLCMSFWCTVATVVASKINPLGCEIDFRHPAGVIVFFAGIATAVIVTKIAVRLSL